MVFKSKVTRSQRNGKENANKNSVDGLLVNDLTKMLTMLALAVAIIKRIGHAVLQYLLTSIARCRSVGMETVARRSERAWRMRTSFWRSDHARLP
jgi:hypothetical protein